MPVVDARDDNYTWQYGLTQQFFAGTCQQINLSFGTVLALHTSYHQHPVIEGVDPDTGAYECSYGTLACTSGYPTCDATKSNPPIGSTFGACPAIISVRYLFDYGGGDCGTGLALPSASGGQCT